MVLAMVSSAALKELHLIKTITCMLLIVETTGYRSLLLMVCTRCSLRVKVLEMGNYNNYPYGLKAHNSKVYISDHDNNRISVFQTNGIFLHTIVSGELGTLYDVTVNGNNQLLVVDCAHYCIYIHTGW